MLINGSVSTESPRGWHQRHLQILSTYQATVPIGYSQFRAGLWYEKLVVGSAGDPPCLKDSSPEGIIMKSGVGYILEDGFKV